LTDTRLTLVAATAADLPTLSALLQDAIVRAGDVAWDKPARRLVILASRYRWETTDKTRTRTALRLESVLSVQHQNWPRDPETALNLLAMTADAETITIAFAGNISLRANTECIDALLEDLTPAWPVRHTPEHE
jgi:hypothetical protein